MPDVQVSSTIKAAPELVWELVADVTRMGQWSPETTSCRWLGDAAGPRAPASATPDGCVVTESWSNRRPQATLEALEAAAEGTRSPDTKGATAASSR